MDSNIVIEQNLFSGQYETFDSLGFNTARGAFIGIIKSVQAPFTIALYGQWGSGKSTMIAGISQQLEKDDYLTLTFDAWKYRHEKNLVLPLICSLQREHLSKFAEVKDSAKKVVASMAFASLSGYLKHKTGIDIGDVKASLEIYEDGYKHYKKYDDQISQIEDEYRGFVSTLLGKNKKEKLVVFIDNLDRCLPDMVVNLLDDISSFLSIKDVKCVYVLAMDKENAIKAIHHRYPDVNGRHYLEKIVQVGLSMPRIDTPERWIDHFQKTIKQEESSLFGVDIPLVLEELKKIPELLCNGGVLDNPRRVERFIHKYFVLKKMGKINGEEKKENISVYIFSVILKEYFSRAYHAIQTQRDEKYLVTLITWSREAQSTPELMVKEVARPQFKIQNQDLYEEYTKNPSFYRFLKGFRIPLPEEGSLGIFDIKKKLDLVD